ncbi:MAG: hypothetical protein JJT85_05230 [Chromatiales bacterium]|nr:hypothetical protein [Chromatiales bacterium]
MTDFDDMMRNPADAFTSPADIVGHPELSAQQKVQLLRQWKDDATRLLAATGENMPGTGAGPAELLRQVNLALEKLAG